MNRQSSFAVTRAAVLAGLGLVAGGVASAQPLTPAIGAPVATDIAIVGAIIHLDSKTTLTNGTIVLRGGRVFAVGENIAVPDGATVISGEGKVVTAGLIESISRLGLEEVSQESSTIDGSFSTDGDSVVHAAFRALDGYNQASVAIPVSRHGGVTSALSAPWGALVSGGASWVNLADGPLAERVIVADAAMHARLGAGAAAATDGSRAGAIAKLREILDDAQRYGNNRAAYDRNQSRALAASRLDLAALQPVLAGRVPLVIDAERASDIRAALALAGTFKLKLVISGGTEAWLVAKELAAAKVPVILDAERNLPSSFDMLHVRDDQAAYLANAGVEVILSTRFEAANVRKLRQLAGIAIGYGMSFSQALAAVTEIPARVFGNPERGTIAKGSAADLVVWSGPPFELSSHAEHVFIGGVEQSLVTRQTRLFERYRSMAR